MVKIGFVDLKEKITPKDEYIFNVEPCLKVEELLESYELKTLGNMGSSFDRLNNGQKGLEILCKIPKSLEGLRQLRELK